MRFVNRAAAKGIAPARPSSSACEETSIAHARSPPSSIARRSACRSIASGVVLDHLALLASDHGLDGAEQPALHATGLQQLAHEVGAGRLAVGAGHADDPQLGRRLTVEARRQRRHRGPHRRDAQLGHAEAQRALDDERRRAVPDGGRREMVAVGAEAGHAEEQRPGAHRTAVVGQRGDLDVGVAALGPGADEAGQPGGELAEPHSGVPSFGIESSLVSAPEGACEPPQWGWMPR